MTWRALQRAVPALLPAPVHRHAMIEPMKTLKQMLEEANAEVDAVPPRQAMRWVGNPEVVFIDLRDSAELAQEGRIPGSVHANRGMLEFLIDPASPFHNPVFASGKSLVFYCAGGGRSALASRTAQEMGLEVTHLQGGFIQSRSHVQEIPLFPITRTANSKKSATAKLEILLDEVYMLNPGSVGQPRDRDNRAAYAIYDTDGIVEYGRVHYDIESAMKKIVDAGLPDTLAYRLTVGR
jgi:rhodanese-related sulfurtransferase